MNRVEEWRRRAGKKQKELAQEIGSSDAVIVSAEKGLPIKARYITALIGLSNGFLRPRDFKEAKPKRTANGTAQKSRQGTVSRRRKGEGERD